MSLFGGAPLAATDVAHTPDDAILAFAGRLEPSRLFELARSFAALTGETEDFEQSLAQFGQAVGVDVEEDLLPHFGDIVQLYTTPRDGDVVTGWTLSISVKNHAKVAAANEKFVAAMKQIGGFRAPKINPLEFGGETIHSFSIPDDDVMVEPSWCLTKSHLIIGLFPQSVKSHLRGMATKRPSIHDRPEVAKLFNTKAAPTILGYNDTAAILRRIYPALQIGLKAMLIEMQEEGFDLDLNLLPSCDALTSHMQPGTFSVRSTKFGPLMETRQTLPAGNLGAVMPVAMIGSIPASVQARIAANRARNMNTLRQIGLAMLNYESATQRYPARYTIDADGKPLLSWRVHILPYIEENALYEQFKLDEPWDSPHNRKLVAKMPEIYRSPAGNAGPGKTNYVAFEDDKGVIIPPPKGRRQGGRRIREIRDGTSKTMLVVQVPDESAKIWTKPGDFQVDQQNPFNGLVDKQGFFTAVFCDGHVSQFHKSIGKETLRLLIEVADGQPVQAW